MKRITKPQLAILMISPFFYLDQFIIAMFWGKFSG